MRLFKYVSADAAKHILRSNQLRWSPPLSFDDPFDAQFDQHIECDEQRALVRIEDELWAIYTGRKQPAVLNKLGRTIQIFRKAQPSLTRKELFGAGQQLRGAVLESIRKAHEALPPVQAQIRKLVFGIKVLCLSEINDNLLMWSHYGLHHTGAVLEFSTETESDNLFKAAEPVEYRTSMPRMLSEDDMVALLSGQFSINKERVWHNAVFVKAADWAYEREWRIYLSSSEFSNEHFYTTFNKEQLIAIYFGCRMSAADNFELFNYTREHFPDAKKVYARKSERDFALDFVQFFQTLDDF